MLGNLFTQDKIRVIPRRENQVADSLATIARNFKVPIYSKKISKMEVVIDLPFSTIVNTSKYLKII